MLIDTHCHIHESELFPPEKVIDAIANALAHDVNKIICVGTNQKSSIEAVEFSNRYEFCYATVGIHPHDTRDGIEYIGQMLRDNHKNKKVVAIGEIGLDYYYNNSPRETQIKALEQQLQWAKDFNLPVNFHVREAFTDFWSIFANFSGIRGVLHSYTDSLENLDKALGSGLYIGVNGISTFSKTNQEMWDHIPLEKMLLETDAPFLTPVPYRGKVNEPAFVRHVAEYHASKRGVELEHLARATSTNASTLFSL